MVLDPALSDFTGVELSRLDRMIKETFGEKLFSPGDMTGPGETLNQAVRKNVWPLSLLGGGSFSCCCSHESAIKYRKSQGVEDGGGIEKVLPPGPVLEYDHAVYFHQKVKKGRYRCAEQDQ
jgi:hypothetical protein